MKRRSKIIATLITLGLALSMVAIGVYSATLVSFGISGNISYKVEDVFCRINTQLYYSTDNVVLKYADAYNAGYDLSQAETLPSNIAKAPTTYFSGKEIKSYDNTTGQMITPTAEDLIISGIQLPLGSYDSTAESVKSYKYYIVIEVENYGQNDITVQVTDTTSSENATLLKNVQRDITNNNVVIPQNETKKVVIAVSIINLKENILSTEIDYSVLVQEKQEKSLTTAIIDTIENGNTTQITTSFDSSTSVEGVSFNTEIVDGLSAGKINITLSNIPENATTIAASASAVHSLGTMIAGLYEHSSSISSAYSTCGGYMQSGQFSKVALDGIFSLANKDENNYLEICLIIPFNEILSEDITNIDLTLSYSFGTTNDKVLYSFANEGFSIYANNGYFESNENVVIQEGEIKSYLVHTDGRAYNVESVKMAGFLGVDIVSVYLPETVTIIEDSVFEGCIELAYINLENIVSIGTFAFEPCPSLTIIDLSSANIIGEQAFYGCTGITNVIIPDTVTSIGANAFGRWTEEQSIYFEGTMPENLHANWNDGCNAKIYLNGVLQN